MAGLAKKHKDVIDFFVNMAHGEDFRQQALLAMDQVFNLEHSTFFLIDPEGNLYDPVAHNVEFCTACSYVEHFQDVDIFHPRNISLERHVRNPVMTVTDVMPLEEFEQTAYYNDFLKQHGYYHEMIINLVDDGRLVGGIGLYKPKDEAFAPETRDQLEVVGRFLEGQLAQHLSLEKALADQRMYQRCLNTNPVGVILFDADRRVMYSNSAARKMVAELLHGRLNLDGFVPHAVSLTGGLPGSSKATSLRLYSPSLEEFTIRVAPVEGRFGRRTYLMEMMPGQAGNRFSPGPQVHGNIQGTYGLSDRELQVLGLVMQGLTNVEAGQSLFISPNTVKAHLRGIMRKTGTGNRLKLFQKIRGLRA